MNSPHKVSVICPAFNASPFVLETLSCVLTQSVAPVEVIVVDDGSTDDTLKRVEEFFAMNTRGSCELKLLSEKHAGPGAARNAGIRAATGDWIAFIDSDDLWMNEKLGEVSNFIAAHSIGAQSELNFICHSEVHIHFDGSRSELHYGRMFNKDKPLPPQLYRRCLFSTSAVVCKRKLFFDYGFFSETLMSGQDYDLWLTISPHLNVGFIDKLLGVYRDRRGNISSGAAIPRLENLFRIYWHHRDKVSPILTATMLSRLLAFYLFEQVRRLKVCL